ncbi:MAG TPA: C4-type zinc ribbon domain-containing protein [Pyrinomonadaceae bacterium]|nr:C4-type zinc ribbon domain-containing protein [Pyrinomonadaceae bacterium]
MNSELEKLIELQKTDTNIRRLKKAIESAEERRAGIEQEFERHASSIREIQNRRDATRAQRADLEKQIAENQNYLERANRNLKTAQDHKQYETAMRETDALQKQITALDNKVLEQMTEIEEVEKTLAERADEISSLEGNQTQALKDFDAEVSKNREEIENETKTRHELFVTLPPQMASVYNRLAQRSRDGIAVAEVVNGACSACNMSLRKQVQQQLRTSNSIMTCESCTRILYVNQDAKAANQEK